MLDDVVARINEMYVRACLFVCVHVFMSYLRMHTRARRTCDTYTEFRAGAHASVCIIYSPEDFPRLLLLHAEHRLYKIVHHKPVVEHAKHLHTCEQTHTHANAQTRARRKTLLDSWSEICYPQRKSDRTSSGGNYTQRQGGTSQTIRRA